MNKIMFLLLLFLLLPTVIVAKDEQLPASWTMYKGDASHQGFMNTKALRANPAIKWKFDTCLKRYLYSFIHNNKLYVPANIGLLYEYDRSTGKEINRFTPGNPLHFDPYIIGDRLYAYFQDWRLQKNVIIGIDLKSMGVIWDYSSPEPFLSPVAANENYLYIGKADGTLTVIDIISKQIVWTAKSEGGIAARPTTYSDYVFYGTQSGDLFALDALEGKLRWQFKTGGGILASPIVVKDFLITVSLDKNLYVHDIKSGALAWSFPTESGIIYTPAVKDNTIYVGSSAGEINAITIDKVNVWSYKEPAGIISPLAVDDERVYFVNQSLTLIALSRKNGAFLWKASLDNSVTSPLLTDGTAIYMAASDYYYAFDGKTGKSLWTDKLPCEIFSSPVLDDAALYFGTTDGSFYAFDYQSGKQLWKFTSYGLIYGSGIVLGTNIGFESRDNKLRIMNKTSQQEVDAYNVMANQFFSPTQAGNILILDGLGYLVAYDYVAKKELWKTIPLDIMRWKAYTTAAVSKDTVVYGSNDNIVYAVSLKDGKAKWQYRTEAPVQAAPSIAGDTVFCSSMDKNVYALDLKTGKLKWKFATDSFVQASPSIAYKTIYFGSFDKYLYAVDMQTGQLKWKFKSDNEIAESAAIADNTVYFGTKGGTLYAVDAQSGSELWSFKTLLPILTVPVIKDGEVYFAASDGYIYALTESKQTKENTQ